MSNPTEPPCWGTIQDAADHLAIDPKTVRRMIARGEIEARRLGNRLIRVDLTRLDDLGRPMSGPRA